MYGLFTHVYGSTLEAFYVIAVAQIRVLVIATKYAFFRPEDLNKMDNGPEAWDPLCSARNMLLGGWCGAPRKIPGLLDECVQGSMDRCDVDLGQVDFKCHGIDGADGDERSYNALATTSRIVYKCFGASMFQEGR